MESLGIDPKHSYGFLGIRVKNAIFEYTEVFYDRIRQRSTLRHLNPRMNLNGSGLTNTKSQKLLKDQT